LTPAPAVLDFSPPGARRLGPFDLLDEGDQGEAMMRLATSDHIFDPKGACAPYSLRTARERGVRPAVGFQSPEDVLKDPHLSRHDKRLILSSWASDASAVQDEPRLRWLLGTVEPVPLEGVLAALTGLDDLDQGDRRRAH
jgi:hypothetical protein